MSIVLRSRKTLAQRYRGVLKKYSTSHLWDFGVAQGPLAYAATHTAAEFLAAYPLWHLYQDAAGSVPACKPTDPVGLCLDQPTGVVTLGPELILGGALTSPSAWTVGGSDGTHVATFSTSGCRYQSGTTSPQLAVSQTAQISLVIGKVYRLSFEIANYVSGAIKSDAFMSGAPFPPANGVYSYAAACTISSNFSFTRATTDVDLSIANISIREIIGAHASQATTTKRPILSGRVNVLAQSHDATNAAWIKVGGTTAPNATTVNLPNFLEAFFSAYSTVVAAGSKWTGSFLLSGSGTVYILVARYSGGAYEDTTRKVTLTATPTLYQVTHTMINAQTGVLAGLSRNTDGTATSVTFGGADLRPANSPTNIPAYQRVTSATDYDTVGFPVRALFDGVDDCLVVPSLDLTLTDKVTVVAGVTKLSDAAAGMILEYGATFGAQGTFYIASAETSGDYSFQGKGSTSGARISKTGFASPHSGVLSTKADISGSSRSARVNGGAYTTDTTTLGTGSLSVNALNIGARNGGASTPFNGVIQSLAVIGNLLPDGEVQILEASANAAMGKVY